jgi:hypothetical protein
MKKDRLARIFFQHYKQNFMAKSSRGRSQDRRRVAGGQSHEMSYMREKFDISAQQLSGAIRAVGNNRKEIEKYLKEKTGGRR